jgi:hypothetical protein
MLSTPRQHTAIPNDPEHGSTLRMVSVGSALAKAYCEDWPLSSKQRSQKQQDDVHQLQPLSLSETYATS